LESEVNSISNDLQRLENNLNENKNRIEINNIKLAEDKSAVEDINERLSYVGKNDQQEAIKRIEDIKQSLSQFDSFKTQLNVTVNTLNTMRSSLTEEIQQLQEKKSQQEYMLVRVDADIEQMQERILEEYHLEYSDCLPYKEENYNFDEGVAETAQLKRKMSYLGHINVEAIEQSKEVTKEYDQLNTEKEDLEKASSDMEIIIKDMTAEMLVTFNTEFEKIRVNFIKIFKELFGGGEADLQIIEDSDDPLEYGINILASPPGKKIMSNSQLSGGEQSLTAIAILFAILRLKPMPFCILDEIDSALDDANIGRYAKYLKRFSQETQFIVITHRKPTMEVADNLYGVTMEERGVSKIISVKLSEAESMTDEEKEKKAK
jgi:chromosome segregation protein